MNDYLLYVNSKNIISDNELKVFSKYFTTFSLWVKEIHNYLMLTLKIIKANSPVSQVKNPKKLFVSNWQCDIFGTLFC